jgi:hypothetical protein
VWQLTAFSAVVACAASHEPSPRLPRLARPVAAAKARLETYSQDPVFEAQAFRRHGEPVRRISDGPIIAEAEEFRVQTPGWRALPYGTNYYAATLANTFLSRQAYLGAPEQCATTEASVDVEVPKTGRYFALARYEAAYRFETQFRLRIDQNGKTKLDRLYGARENAKIWPFGARLQKDVTQVWGSADSIVWEGHDAAVDLDAGSARLTLVAGGQPEPAARRDVDLVMLTDDQADMTRRIEKEGYLPLDGLLTQAGDVYMRIQNNEDSGPTTLKVPNGIEHSPYWIHQREWKPVTLRTAPGDSTDWIEVGSLLDTLSGGQWNLAVAGEGKIRFDLEVGVRDAAGRTEPIRRFDDVTGDLALAYFGNTRYSRRITTRQEIVDGVVEYLEQRPVTGTKATRTLLYGFTFDAQPADAAYTARVSQFLNLMGANSLFAGSYDHEPGASPPDGYVDVRDLPTAKLTEYCAEHQAKGDADKIGVISLGDEIALAEPPESADAEFRTWLRAHHIAALDVDPASRGDYAKIAYRPRPEASAVKPAEFYYSNLFAFGYGAEELKARTAILHRCFPHAGIGANFTPHRGHLYLGPIHQWITPFRDGSLTMPWSEDWVFQVPVGSQQVNLLAVDTFRAAIRNDPDAKIQYYVMPNDPGNTPAAWRRQFYGDIGHGVKIVNLFELRPLQAAYTENHVDDPAMYQAIRVAFRELGRFDDIVQDGKVRPGTAALWFSEAADVWDDRRAPFDAHERALYLMIRHRQIPLDIVVEGDNLSPYQALFLSDAHVTRAAARAMAAWVERGGQIIATAGAGMLDEFDQPNAVLRNLFGVDPQPIERDGANPVQLEKQDLPFAGAMDHAHTLDGAIVPVIAARTRFATAPAHVTARFDDGQPAASSRPVGKGIATYIGFLPALAYLKPALPRRPFDRRSDDDAMCHLLPIHFDDGAARMIHANVDRPVIASEPLVESTILQSPHGVLIPLVNWTPAPIKGLKVVVSIPVPSASVTLASGGPVGVERDGSRTVLALDLDVADALVLQ